ncbi:MAG: hypothetical protein KAJ19_21820 [Gammaproteobacteria bacterium]|nr:hypothetical protein [Gammaproteobacteria bacterium]
MTEQYLQSNINLHPESAVFFGGIGALDVPIFGALVTSLPLQVVDSSNPLFVHTLGSSEVEVGASGLLTAFWFTSINVNSGGRKNSKVSLFVDRDDGFGFLPVERTFSFGYHRNIAQGRDTPSAFIQDFPVEQGWKIEVAAQRISGTGNLRYIGAASSLLMALRTDR